MTEVEPVSSMDVYKEAHCGYCAMRAFCHKRWYAETDKVDYCIYDCIRGTKSGEDSSLVHFNGATQRSFHAPPCAWASIYCHCKPTPFECKYRGLDLDN